LRQEFDRFKPCEKDEIIKKPNIESSSSWIIEPYVFGRILEGLIIDKSLLYLYRNSINLSLLKLITNTPNLINKISKIMEYTATERNIAHTNNAANKFVGIIA
jgi:hypothetical protein